MTENDLRENTLTFDKLKQIEHENHSSMNGFGGFLKKEETTANALYLNQNNSQSITQFVKNIGVNFLQVFSNPVGFVYFIFRLKWYVILCMLVIGTFLFFQIESAIETRKEKRKIKKEGMHNKHTDQMRGIIHDHDGKHKQAYLTKRVSFYEPLSKNDFGLSTHFNLYEFVCNSVKNVEDFFIKIYNLWIVPFIYVTFRNIGVR